MGNPLGAQGKGLTSPAITQ